MPKKVDHQARRLELTEALWRLTHRDGWEAISLRNVAAEAEVSMGMVQHYFTSKDEMLLFALEMISEDVRARIRDRVAALPEPHTPRRVVATVLTEMIPDPSRRQSEAAAASVFIRRFMLSPESSAQLAASNPDLEHFLAEQIRHSRRPSDVAGGDATVDTERARQAEPELDAARLTALLDGLIVRVGTGVQSPRTARAIVETELDHVFGSSVSCS